VSFHPRQALTHVRFPAVEAGGNRRSSFGIALGELAGERACRATAAPLLFDLVLDDELEPAVLPRL
jgi:hypothetical protein